ncbi:MAG: FG-GAP repeat protein [Planctomycetes bacterium]|nr:FG-GAP repeat protein [Planctomycetota bacterium]
MVSSLLLAVAFASPALAQPGWVLSHQKISDTEGGFTGTLDDDDLFGRSVAFLGDLNGDGVGDLAVGANGDDDGGLDRGAVWVLFLNTDGTVKSYQKISDTQGGFTGTLDTSDNFGRSVASLGDLDGDGVGDLVVGADGDDDGAGSGLGAVWILFLNTDGTVKSHQKISATQGGFTGTLDGQDRFGMSVASLGDLDGDGVGDLAVGANGDDDGSGRLCDDPFACNQGAVWVLFLNPNGTVRTHQKISAIEGGFTGTLDEDDNFGWSAASLGDLDGDGVGDLAVGAWGDDDGCELNCNRGAVWILFLNTDGTIKTHQKISDTQGGFAGTMDDFDGLGISMAALGDLDGDRVGDLAVGAPGDDDGSAGPCRPSYLCNRGAVWVLFLNANGTVKSHQKISDTEGGFTGTLDDFDYFGYSVAGIGDLDGDGSGDLAVGANFDNDGGSLRGAVWVLFLDGVPAPGKCPWDLDGTGGVGILDLLALLAAWGTDPGGPPDFDGDGTVGILDLLTLLANWGPCP